MKPIFNFKTPEPVRSDDEVEAILSKLPFVDSYGMIKDIVKYCNGYESFITNDEFMLLLTSSLIHLGIHEAEIKTLLCFEKDIYNMLCKAIALIMYNLDLSTTYNKTPAELYSLMCFIDKTREVS